VLLLIRCWCWRRGSTWRIGQDDFIARPEPQAASSLSELAALLDWREIDRALAGISAAAKGELGWPPPALFRVLLPFPAEQARIVHLLVDRVDISVTGADIRLRTAGLAGLVRDLGAELAAAEKIDRSYLARTLRLTLLAPDIVGRSLFRCLRCWRWCRACGTMSGPATATNDGCASSTAGGLGHAASLDPLYPLQRPALGGYSAAWRETKTGAPDVAASDAGSAARLP
jgi:hypothetical protein